MRTIIRITTIAQSLQGLLKGQLKFMSERGFNVIGISSPGKALEEVRIGEGVTTCEVEMTRTISPMKDLKSLIRLIKLFLKEKPDIVHTHTPKAGLLGMLAAKIVGVPHRLHTVAGMPLLETVGAKRLLLNQMEKLTYASATRVYPNSYGLQKIIIAGKFANPKKVKVIAKGSSNGIDVDFFNAQTVSRYAQALLRKRMGISEDDYVFLYVGRLVKDKGLNELVEAFENVHKEHPKSHLILVGNYERHLDPLSPKTEEVIGTHEAIHAVGYKTNVKDYYAMADVLTFPSYREGFPNVVMQAAAMQLNCIVSDINGCNEIIKHGDNGWLISAKNTDQLADRMKWCLENPTKSIKMGLKSRDIIIKNYERKYVWEEIYKEYKSLIGGDV